LTGEKPHMDEKRFFEKAKVPYQRSKEEVWDELSGKLSEKPARKDSAPVVRMARRLMIAGIAASVLVFLSIGLFLRFHTERVSVPNGQHLTYYLPDSSKIDLNARSALSYNPYWWKFNRNIRFEGEGYFEVREGSTFTVNSQNGTTEVLGTSFNIYSRNEDYTVACITGKVKVKSRSDESVVLGPGYEASVNEKGNISVEKKIRPEKAISWTEGMFNFTGMPLLEVIEEIERQYDVVILINEEPGLSYTGLFSMDKPVEEVLGLICKPFGLTFVEKSDGVYQLLNNDQ